jgi:hypothetical protein
VTGQKTSPFRQAGFSHRVPGGSGNGMLTCLEQMDLFCRHTGAVIFDYVGINHWNNDYKKQTVYEAAKAMAAGQKNEETV